jgi:hypothetical protein
MKKIGLLLLAILMSSLLFANGNKDSNENGTIVASTSWTAAFADLAGIDNVNSIAPASLRHPPEYEITVSDIEKIHNSSIFIYAGFERMMKTLGEAIGNTKMIKITCDNSIATVKESSSIIATICGTQSENEKRVSEYVGTIEKAASEISKKGLKNEKVLCNKNQIYLAKDLGFENITVFGPGPVTSEQIADAKNTKYDFIIDNVHNPVGSPLVEVSPKSKYVIWRNFPETIEKNALLHVVQSNINALLNK